MKEETKKKLYKELVQDTIDNRNSSVSFYTMFAFLLFIAGTFIAGFAVSNIFKQGTDGAITYQTSPLNIQAGILQIIFGGICLTASIGSGLMAISTKISGNRNVDYYKELYFEVVSEVKP